MFALLPALLSFLAPHQPARVGGSVLHARLFDESGTALGSQEIWYGIECDERPPDADACSCYVGGTACTDANGLLRIELDEAQSLGLRRTLRLTLAEPRQAANTSALSELMHLIDEPPAPPRIRPPYAECTLSATLVSGEIALRDLVLRPPGAPERFAPLDDAGLCARYLDLLEISEHTQRSRVEALDELLCELVRRGTPTCESFIASRRHMAQRDPSGLGSWGDLPELALFTALRRVQRRPDPVVIRVIREQPVETTFPRFPTVAVALHNGAPDGATVNLVPALLDYGLDGTGPGGEILSVSRCAGHGFSGGGQPATLAPGDELPRSLAVASRLRMNSPGEYLLRVSLLPGMSHSPERDLRGHIALQSGEVRVMIRPLRIRLSRTEHDQHLAWLRGIDTARSIVVLEQDASAEPVDSVRRPAGEGLGPKDAPEDGLYRAGLRALPALFDALGDPSLDPPHRAWTVAMLWNLTGVRECGYEGVGRIHECAQWPTLRSDGPILASRGGYRSEPLDEARLARTIERWKSYRSFLEVEWTD